jgi:hypothetical protein
VIALAITASWKDENLAVAAARDRGQCAHRGGLARTGRRAQRLHQPRRPCRLVDDHQVKMVEFERHKRSAPDTYCDN